MDTLKKIRRRLAKSEKNEEKNNRSPLLSFLSYTLLVASLILGFLIYSKKDEEGKFLNDNFGVKANFKTFNQGIEETFHSLFVFYKDEEDLKVASKGVVYYKIEDNIYKQDGNVVEALKDGQVISFSKQKEGNAIILYYGNDLYALYFNIILPNVKIYDHVKKGDVIGTYQESFKVLFKQNDKLIDYEEVISK